MSVNLSEAADRTTVVALSSGPYHSLCGCFCSGFAGSTANIYSISRTVSCRRPKQASQIRSEYTMARPMRPFSSHCMLNSNLHSEGLPRAICLIVISMSQEGALTAEISCARRNCSSFCRTSSPLTRKSNGLAGSASSGKMSACLRMRARRHYKGGQQHKNAAGRTCLTYREPGDD